MIVLVRYFGYIAEQTGLQSEVFELNADAHSDELKHRISTKYNLWNLPFSLAVNLEILQSAKPLTDRDEVALLPPFAGG